MKFCILFTNRTKFSTNFLNFNLKLVGEGLIIVNKNISNLKYIFFHVTHNFINLHIYLFNCPPVCDFPLIVFILSFICRAKIAEAILERSEAFIFGINSLMGSIIYASFTFVITSRFGLQLGIREQTSFLGGFALLLGIGFIILGILKWKKDGHFTPCAKFLEKGKCCKRRDGQAAWYSVG